MTDRATLEALLARVLEGEGPDQELDGQLALLKGYTYEKRKGDKFAWWRRPDGFRIANYGNENRPPPYTTSLEAALTLVPEGWGWCVFSADPVQRSSPGAVLYDNTYVPPDDKYEYDRPTIDASATTTVRALLAVCIKARL